MKWGKFGRHILLCILVVLLAVPPGVLAQGPPPGPPPPGGGQPAPSFRPEELEQLVAPIALYPDPLLAQIFMASTYPLEIVQADRFAKANAQVKGPQLDEALKQQTWDDSVKSLVSFPPVLSMMSEKLDWTQKLGDAVLADQRSVLNAVQVLRGRAQAAGNLQTTAEQRVIVEPAPPPVVQPGESQTVVIQQPPQIIQIQPANPEVVQLPAYNPAAIYGPWPYPAYPPYPYYPPGYVAGAALLSFGIGMAVGGALWGNCNWGGGDININRSNYQNFSNNVNRSDIANNRVQNLPARDGGRGNWQHNAEHRRAVPYRDQGTAQRFGQGTRPGADGRDAFRGRAEAGRQQLGQGGLGDRGGFSGQRGPGGGFDRGPGGGLGDRGGQGFGGQRGPGGGLSDRGGLGSRGGVGGGQGFGGGRQPGAFQGMGQGGQTRNSSNRGAASRQGMSAPRGGGGAPRGGGGAPRGGGGGPRGGGGGRRR